MSRTKHCRGALYSFLTMLAIGAQPALTYAAVADHVVLGRSEIVKLKVVETGVGYTKLLVASNSPFKLHARNVIGNVCSKVQRSGMINGRNFGASAQMPGNSNICRSVTTGLMSEIYIAERKTAMSRGGLIDQSVEITVTYDEHANPEIWATPIN